MGGDELGYSAPFLLRNGLDAASSAEKYIAVWERDRILWNLITTAVRI
jgi:hypothetical protein